MTTPVLAAPLPSTFETELRRLRAQVIAATWMSYAGFYMCRKVIGVVKGPLKGALLSDDQRIAHLTTAYLIAYMIGQFVTAGLSRRVSSRQLLLWGMSLSALCNLGIGAFTRFGSPGYSLILGAMAVHGFAQATGWSANVGIMANWTRREERGRIMAAWGTCYQLGSAAAKSFAAFMFGWLGLAWSFWGSSILLFAICVLFFFWGRESPESAGLAPLKDDAAVHVHASPEKAASHAAADTRRIVKMIIVMGLIYFSFKFLRYALDSWSALILQEHFSLSTDTAGYISSAFDWFGFAGVLVAGWVSDRFFRGMRIPVIFLGAVGAFVATGLLWGVGLNSVWVFAGLLGMIGFMMMGPDSLLSGAAAQDVGGRKWAVIAAGIINGLGSIGPVVQEEVIGWLKQSAGVTAVLLLLVGIAAAAAVGSGAFWVATRASKTPL